MIGGELGNLFFFYVYQHFNVFGQKQGDRRLGANHTAFINVPGGDNATKRGFEGSFSQLQTGQFGRGLSLLNLDLSYLQLDVSIGFQGERQI